MRISRDGVPAFYVHNAKFNKAAGPLVGEIFQTLNEGPIGYIPARESRVAPNDWKPNPAVVQLMRSSIDAPKEHWSKFDLSNLGEYEKVLFSCLVWGDYSTYVLTGEMGSGKTTTTNLIQTVLKQRRSQLCSVCEACDPIIISVDFNQGFRGKNTADLVRRFQKRLSDKLRQYLRRLFAGTKLPDALLEEVSKNLDDSYAAFDRFAQECDSDISIWNARSLRSRADALFQFVDNQAKSEEEKVEMMMSLVRLTKRRLKIDPACLIFLFDNIDSIWPEAQYEILVEILSYMSIATAKALVVLRRSTFHRLQNQAAFSFGCIEHIGPTVSDIITQRVEHYLKNWDNIEKALVLDKKHQDAIRRRLLYIKNAAKDQFGALTEISSLSGGSVRHGLLAGERLLINGAVPYDEDPRYSADLKRAILFGVNSPGIAPDDESVANLFMNPASGEASLLNLRILQLVRALEGDLSKRNVLTLLIMLRQIGNWRGEEVRRSLNYLLKMRRPLLWIDGKAEYESVSQMQYSDDFLYLTEAGYLYLQHLSRDLVYVQEATVSVEWPTNWMPKQIDYSMAVSRFRVLRAALRELMDQDFEQTMRFRVWVQDGHIQFGVPFLLITNRILRGVGGDAFRILRPAVERALRGDSVTQLSDEINDWLSLINVGLKREREISGMYKSLDFLSRDFTNLNRLIKPMNKRMET